MTPPELPELACFILAIVWGLGIVLCAFIVWGVI